MPCILPKPPHPSCWRGLISPNDLRMMTVRTKGILERPPAIPSVEGAGPSPGHRRRLRSGLWWLGAGFPVLPAWGGAWGPLRLLPIKQSWHFRARQRRWLPALEASIWPLSQHRLPGPSPLTSADPDRGPQPAVVILPAPQWGHSGAQQCPREGTPPCPSGVPLAAAFACVGGCGGGRIWLWRKQLAARGNATEDWIVDGGHRNAPHVTGPRGALPSLSPAPGWGSGASEGPVPEGRAAGPPLHSLRLSGRLTGSRQSESQPRLCPVLAVWD